VNPADLTEEVRKILVDDWDPIGVGGNPNLRDEYDAALGPIIRPLAESPNVYELKALLAGLEASYGVAHSNPGRGQAARKLRALRESVENWPV
jgi:hypothetical protein